MSDDTAITRAPSAQEFMLALNEASNALPALNTEGFDDIFGALGAMKPWITFYTGNSSAVIRKQITADHYGLSTKKDEIIDLGDSIDFLVLAVRAKAVDTNTPMMVVYDRTDEDYTRIKDASDNAPRGVKSGFLYGPEFLVWFPGAKDVDPCFATLFAKNKSERSVAAALSGKAGQWVNLGVRLAETKKEGKTFQWNTWDLRSFHGNYDFPSISDVKAELDLFANAKKFVQANEKDASESDER